MSRTLLRVFSAGCTLLLLAACSTARVREATQEPAGQPPRVRSGYTEPDVHFMQGMIGHHAQALTMSAMVADRTARPELKLLAERIAVSQNDEIATMRRWLQKRGEALPDPKAHEHAALGHGELMPGMLTADEMTRLERAKGAEFDRLFLESMIRHHEGALAMVAKLLAASGSGQEPELYLFVTDVNADQESEIRRMRSLLSSLPR